MTKFDKVLLSCTGFEAGEHVVVPNPNGFVLEWFPIFSYAGLGVFFLVSGPFLFGTEIESSAKTLWRMAS